MWPGQGKQGWVNRSWSCWAQVLDLIGFYNYIQRTRRRHTLRNNLEELKENVALLFNYMIYFIILLTGKVHAYWHSYISVLYYLLLYNKWLKTTQSHTLSMGQEFQEQINRVDLVWGLMRSWSRCWLGCCSCWFASMISHSHWWLVCAAHWHKASFLTMCVETFIFAQWSCFSLCPDMIME